MRDVYGRATAYHTVQSDFMESAFIVLLLQNLIPESGSAVHIVS